MLTTWDELPFYFAFKISQTHWIGDVLSLLKPCAVLCANIMTLNNGGREKGVGVASFLRGSMGSDYDVARCPRVREGVNSTHCCRNLINATHRFLSQHRIIHPNQCHLCWQSVLFPPKHSFLGRLATMDCHFCECARSCSAGDFLLCCRLQLYPNHSFCLLNPAR